MLQRVRATIADGSMAIARMLGSPALGCAVANLKRRMRAMAGRGMLGAAGAIVLVVALCFFLVAAHLWLSGLLNPIASAAIIGGVLLVIALILFFVASRPVRAARSRGEPGGAAGRDAARRAPRGSADVLGGAASAAARQTRSC